MEHEEVEALRREMEAEAARRGAPDALPPMPPIPADRYRDASFFEAERRFLWQRSWLFAAHADELPEIGSYLVWDRLGFEIVIVRTGDGEVRAFYNVCRHRGAPVVREARGTVSRFQCGFHSWVYGLDGALQAVPDEAAFAGLDKACLGLEPVRCERLGGWIFVNCASDAPALLEHLGTIPGGLAQFGPDTLRLMNRHTVRVACNWKVALDAFVEVYHLQSLHNGTIHRLLDARRTTISLYPDGHSRMVTAKRPGMEDAGFGVGAPHLANITELPRFANLSYFIFPNLHIATDMTGFPFLQFWPVDIRTSELEISWFVGDWGEGEVPEHWQNAVKIFDIVLQEDLDNLEAIQRSVESPGMRRSPLSYAERRIYHHHAEIDRRLGSANVGDGLAVPPVLDPLVER